MNSSRGDKAFKLAIAVSIIFHTLIFGIIVKKPFSSTKSKKTVYYVDMMNFGGGGTPPQKSNSKKVVKQKTVTKKASMKELKAESSKIKKKSSLTYSKPVKKVKKRRKINRKKRVKLKKKKIVRSPLEEVFKNYEKKKSSDNSTGVGFGLGEGSGGSPLLGKFPYAYYIELIKNRIASNWITGSVGLRFSDKIIVVVSFRILKNGRVVDINIEKSSGINALDTSALRAVKYSIPLPPLPATYGGKDLTVFIQFVYGGKK